MPRDHKNTGSLMSGTTILAFRFDEGILCAADRKVSVDDAIITTEYEKIHQITESSILMGAGSVAFIQFMKDKLSEACAEMEKEVKEHVALIHQASLLAHLCRVEGGEDDFHGVLAGVDPDGSYHMIRVSDEGTVIPFQRYTACGSGGESAMVALELLWRDAWLEGLSRDIAISLAIRAIAVAALHDSATSDPRTVPPSVAIITDTATLLPKKDIEKRCRRMFSKDRKLDARVEKDKRLR